MRTSAFALAIVVVTTLVYSVRAEDDFSALLADLTFTDAPSPAEPLTMTPAEPAEELAPVPSFPMPAAAPATVDIAAMLESGDFEMLESDNVEPVETVPQIALQDPIPSPQPTSPSSVNLNPLFAPPAAATSVPSKAVGHRLHSVAQGCQGGCDQPVACGPEVICRPRTNVNLPSSTLLQYFRSDACYTNIWDGYRRSCRHHSHIHGTCDCFNRKPHAQCGEVLNCAPANCAPANCAPANCASCDGACD